MHELINSVNVWTASTTVFLDDFNDISAQLATLSDVAKKDGDEKVKDESDEPETKDGAADEVDAEKAKEERDEKIETANEIIQKIAVSSLVPSLGRGE